MARGAAMRPSAAQPPPCPRADHRAGCQTIVCLLDSGSRPIAGKKGRYSPCANPYERAVICSLPADHRGPSLGRVPSLRVVSNPFGAVRPRRPAPPGRPDPAHGIRRTAVDFPSRRAPSAAVPSSRKVRKAPDRPLLDHGIHEEKSKCAGGPPPRVVDFVVNSPTPPR